MELLVNDLSISGQFPDIASFRDAIGRVMAMHQVAGRYGRTIHCHRNMAYAQVTPTLSMPQAIQEFTLDQRRVIIPWLHRQGPFWEDARAHSPDDYLECDDAVVTETAVGEAAYCRLHGIDRHLVSLIPSAWGFSPVTVRWTPNTGEARSVDVVNHIDPQGLEAALLVAQPPLSSWAQLATMSIARFPNITFSEDAFEPLRGHPFADGAAGQLLVRLDTLNRFKTCFDESGKRSEEGNRLYTDHFTGDNGWFSDSSDPEKRDFESELTFNHPEEEGERLFCPWHGKVKTSQLRIHFSWPVRADEPLFVVYVGPKITRR